MISIQKANGEAMVSSGFSETPRRASVIPLLIAKY